MSARRTASTADQDPMLYIDTEECNDCGACVPACPPAAILPEAELPEPWKKFIQINADYFKNKRAV